MCSVQVKSAIDALDRRLLQEKGRPLTKKEHLVLRLHAQYPNDVGVLSAFFLNLVELKADQARPHAQHCSCCALV